MLETAARLLRLLALLQSRSAWSGPELAGRLGVSTRTVRNDVERLRTLGYPVEATRGPLGSYRLGAGAQLPPLLLDDDEAVALALGLRAASASAVERVAESSARALAKLEQVLPSRLRRQVATLTAATTQIADDAGTPEDDPAVDPSTLTTLAAAIRDTEWLRFRLEGTAVLVEPYRLVSWERRWYLLGREPESGRWRVFRVDRMVLGHRTGRRFTPQPLPAGDLRAHVMRAVAHEGWDVHARITVLAPAAAVRARINPAVGVVEEVDEDTCVLVTGADSVETMAVYVSLLDMEFRVTEPPELVERLRTLADRYAAAAGGRTAAPDLGEVGGRGVQRGTQMS